MNRSTYNRRTASVQLSLSTDSQLTAARQLDYLEPQHLSQEPAASFLAMGCYQLLGY